MHDLEDSTMHKIEKGWSIAASCSEERLKRVYGWTDDEYSVAMHQGLVMLETITSRFLEDAPRRVWHHCVSVGHDRVFSSLGGRLEPDFYRDIQRTHCHAREARFQSSAVVSV
ncbi:hypothetical protein THARTR1_09582 [Trichoderma harzianum]|uniref:Uncharacterized protein n=1 Tax=Trichoderma harzianum TaxID=5544 RepID=A0A2K0TWA8_TRIHA|nr:hypothetical protein THARTR1_09582 [Trichoderma harzianum]